MQAEAIPLDPSTKYPLSEVKMVEELNAGPQFDESRYHEAEQSCHPLSCVLSCIFPCAWLGSCFCIKEQDAAIEMVFGKYQQTYRDAGCHISNPCGRTLRFVSQRKQVCDVPLSKVVDKAGNSLNVSAVVTFYLENPLRAALAVENSSVFVRTSAHAVMKQIVSRYPYEARKGDHSEHNLKTESSAISIEAVQLLQERVAVAGAKILSFSFNEISYAPEIAASMLKRQAATALIEARTLIVKGSVEIVHHAVTELERKGIQMDEETKGKLINDLLTIFSSNSSSN